MAKSDKKYTSLIVYNSITNKLDDEKYDTQKPFTFVEYLNYIVTLDKYILKIGIIVLLKLKRILKLTLKIYT